VSLIGCVDYKFTFADGHHQTALMYDLRMHTGGNPGSWLTIDARAIPIPQDHLGLLPAMGGLISVPPD
jgi:hypothetical protein